MLAGTALRDVHGASGAGVEGVNRAQGVDGLLDVGHRNADERLLERAVLAVAVDGSQVPRGRDDDLVALDLAVDHLLGVVERAAGGLPEARALAGEAGRLAEVLGVAALDK